jgi:hypothetical protein
LYYLLNDSTDHATEDKMKLRIKGNSLRLRVSPSEIERLLTIGRIEETIRFAPQQDASLTYALECMASEKKIDVRYRPHEVTVVISTGTAHKWAEEEQVGVYSAVNIGGSQLEVAVEKDFACLEGDEADNADTFPNPRSGASC